jgi:hypothetical protein
MVDQTVRSEAHGRRPSHPRAQRCWDAITLTFVALLRLVNLFVDDQHNRSIGEFGLFSGVEVGQNLPFENEFDLFEFDSVVGCDDVFEVLNGLRGGVRVFVEFVVGGSGFENDHILSYNGVVHCDYVKYYTINFSDQNC